MCQMTPLLLNKTPSSGLIGLFHGHFMFTPVIWVCPGIFDACHILSRLWVWIRLLANGACHLFSLLSLFSQERASYKRVLLLQFAMATGNITLQHTVKTDYSVIQLHRIREAGILWDFVNRTEQLRCQEHSQWYRANPPISRITVDS